MRDARVSGFSIPPKDGIWSRPCHFNPKSISGPRLEFLRAAEAGLIKFGSVSGLPVLKVKGHAAGDRPNCAMPLLVG